MDSLGLGLTLDTTLLEKADKTLENMQRNSQLIMQNLNKGFSAFNRGDISDFSKPFDAIKKAMDTIKNSKVSIEFESAGQDRFLDGLNQIMEQVERIRQIGEIGGDKIRFFDPSEVRVTTESLTELKAKAEEIGEAFKEVQKELSLGVEFGKDVSGNDAKIAKLKDDLSEIGKAAELTTKEFKQMEDELKKIVDTRSADNKEALVALMAREAQVDAEAKAENSKISKKELENLRAQDEQIQQLNERLKEKTEAWKQAEAVLKEYSKKLKELRELEAKKEAHDNLQLNRDKEKAYQEMLADNMAEQKFAGATTAQQNAMLVSQEQKRLAETNKEVATLTRLYKEATSNLEKYQGELSELLNNIGTVGKKRTSTQDEEVTRLLKEINQARSILHQLRTEAPEVIQKIEAAKTGEGVQKKAAEDAAKVKASLDYAKVFSDNAKSIDEEIEAISMLKRARNALASDTTADYDKEIAEANKRISKHEDHIKLLTQEQKESKTLEDSVISRYLRERKEADKLGNELRELNRTRKERGTDYSPEEKKNIDAMISRWRTLRQDISEIEANNAAHLSQLQEKYASQRAEEEIKSMLATNEREKQEYAKLLDDLYAIEKQKMSMEKAGAKVGDKAYDNILQQEQDLNNRISQLRAKHQKDLDEIDKKHAKKRNDDEVKAFLEVQKEKQRIAEETQRKTDAYNEKYGTISKADAEAAIISAKDAKNIAQHKKAIEALQKVRAKLDNTDKDYFVTLKNIDEALKEHHKALREAGAESNNLMQSHRGLLNIGGQLARRLALAFSVSQLTQYFRKLVEVRGQFEKTEVALTSIIGDNQKADKLMNQTVALAIKSPFTLQQLTGYTKQLAAYQVSYEELHSTTKMLADVSAGLGVEMDRLILAFGQVKAANYLRATEVRQFTEAGFNILGELADYYNELEGTMLSVGDVQEMVTKRMVDFADVEAVFHRVTEAGGMFFDMQSKQAETLAGQWTNLQDRIDVMLNEIGSDKEGLLKGIVSTLASFIDNWEALADVLKIVVGAFALYKMNLLAVTKAQIANSIAARTLIKEEIKMLGLTKGLSSAWKGLGLSANFTNGAMKKFFAANAWLLALTAILSVIASVISHFNKLNDAVDENTRAFSKNRSEVKKLAEEYSELNSALSETTDKEKKLAIIEEKRAKLQELSVKLRERGLKLTNSEGNTIDPKSIDASLLDELFTSNKGKLDDAYKLGEELGESITRGINAAQGNLLGFSFFGENLQEDAEDLGQTYGKIASHTFSAYMDDVEADIHNNYEKLSQRSQTLYKELAEGRKAEKNDKGEVVKWLESEYDWTKRRLHLLQEISFRENKILGVQLKLNNARANLAHAESEFSHELEGVLNKLIEKYGSIEALKKEYEKNPQVISAAIKTEVDKQSWDENVKWFAEQDLHAQLTIEYNYVEVVSSETPEKVYEGFKKDLINARTNLEKSGKGYSNFFISTEDIDKMEQFTDGLKELQKVYNENIKKRESLKDTTTEEGKAELLMVNTMIAEVERLATVWGYTLETMGGKGKDVRLERLKNQISLVKEMNKEYEKLNKTYSKTESLEKVKKAYADTAKELKLDISKMDFTDKGTIETLEKLLGDPKYSANEYALELKKALDEFKAEVDLEADEQKTRELVDQVQEIFDQYELAVDIKKLNIPPELAKNLFGVDTKSFDQMRTEIISKFAGANAEVSKILSKGLVMSAEDEQKLIGLIGKERVEEAKKAIEKIDDLEEKQQLESAKRFVKFMEKNLDKTKIILEQRGIDITFAKSLFDKGDIDAKTFAEQVKNIVAQSNEEISKFNLDKFKETPEYLQAMGNLGAYTVEELRKLKESLTALISANSEAFTVEEMKVYQEVLEKVGAQIDKLDNNLWFKDEDIQKLKDIKRIEGEINDAKKEEKTLNETLTKQIAERATFEAQLSILQQQRKTAKDAGQDTTAIDAQILDVTSKITNINSEILKTEGQIKKTKTTLSELGQELETILEGETKAIAKLQASINIFNKSLALTTEVYGEIKDIAASFGADTDSGGWKQAENVFGMLQGFGSNAASALGKFATGDIFGGIYDSVKAVFEVIKGINAIHDNALETQIQDHLDNVEELQKDYERLERAIDKAFAFERYGKVAEQTSNLAEQAKNLNKAIALEEDKKDTDPERIKELEGQIEDIENQVEDLFDNLKQELIGSFEDMGDSLADAMIEALKAGEDGIAAWNEEVDAIIAELVKKLTVQKYLEPQISAAIDTLFSRMMPKTAAAEKAAEQYGATSDEAVAAYQKAEGEIPRLDEKDAEEFKRKLELIGLSYEEFAKMIAGITGGEAGGLSALQKGISSITEETAQVIESLLNSMRFTQAESYQQIKEQTGYIKTIRDVIVQATSEYHPLWVKLANQPI